MTNVAFFDAKPYDRDPMTAAAAEADAGLRFQFHEFRLSAETAGTARAAPAVCAFVNDRLDRPCLEALAAACVLHVSMLFE